MELLLPPHLNPREETRLKTPFRLIVVGANGAGKNHFGDALEEHYPDKIFRIGAARALNIVPQKKGKEKGAISALFTSSNGGLSPTLLPEFEQLLVLMRSEGGAIGLQRFNRALRAWEKLFPTHKLLYRENELMVLQANDSVPYHAASMSQGEKAIFYHLGAVLFAPQQAVVLVENPEMYLHPSIVETLWTQVEALRPDCSFLYLTHDIFFATSHAGAERLWVKSYELATRRFDYTFLDARHALPEEVYLELLGSRKPVLFIEGDDLRSIDYRLYPLVFPHYTVKPLGGCNKVIEVTKAFSEMRSFHHLESRGIVDRDRRTFHEVCALRERNIYVPYVAEVENFLLLEPVVKLLAKRQGLQGERLFSQIEKNIYALFRRDMEEQALMHTRYRIRRQLELMIDRRFSSIEEYARHIETLTEGIYPHVLYRKMMGKFRSYIETHAYKEVLRVYNQKSLILQCGLLKAFDFSHKESYLDLLLAALKEESADAEALREAIRACFDLDREANL